MKKPGSHVIKSDWSLRIWRKAGEGSVVMDMWKHVGAWAFPSSYITSRSLPASRALFFHNNNNEWSNPQRLINSTFGNPVQIELNFPGNPSLSWHITNIFSMIKNYIIQIMTHAERSGYNWSFLATGSYWLYLNVFEQKFPERVGRLFRSGVSSKDCPNRVLHTFPFPFHTFPLVLP